MVEYRHEALENTSYLGMTLFQLPLELNSPYFISHLYDFAIISSKALTEFDVSVKVAKEYVSVNMLVFMEVTGQDESAYSAYSAPSTEWRIGGKQNQHKKEVGKVPC